MNESLTPIWDYVCAYRDSGVLRAHMPGHKGKKVLGIEALDITEISGADSLYEADGIIARSQEIATALFGSGKTLYSTEGSSLCIRAMLYLTLLLAKKQGRTPRIWAGRNAHKTFLLGAAVLDIDVSFLYPDTDQDSYLSGRYTPQALAASLEAIPEKERPVAVYMTSPDYLGVCQDLRGIAAVCHQYGALCLVDHAHGAYRKFLSPSLHPMDLDVDICCDSAHKTLSVLTGGAYLHLSKRLPQELLEKGSFALSLFGSTSPSYLILQSLDLMNADLAGDYPEKLAAFTEMAEKIRIRLSRHGFRFYGDEPLKWTVLAGDYGYTGTEMARILREQGVECEFADPDFLVLMLTPQIELCDILALEKALMALPKRPRIPTRPPQCSPLKQAMPLKEALLADSECVPLEQCFGRILAAPGVSCPPAVPIVCCGERIDGSAIALLRYYGVSECLCVKSEKPL